MEHGRDDHELEKVIPEIQKAARRAAIQVLGPTALDLIDEVVAEVNLQLVRAWRRTPPDKPIAWAFTVGLNCARRLGKQASADRMRLAEINDNLALQSNCEPDATESAAMISVEDKLETLDKLVVLVNHTVHDIGEDRDRRIFVLFHVKGQSWEEIAAAVNLSPTAARRRYYRLLTRATAVMRKRALNDPVLNKRCHAILTDDEVFRCALLSLLNVIGREEFPNIRGLLERFLS